MDRRGFLKTLGVLAAAAALPPAVIREWQKNLLIENQVFILDEPMVLEFVDGFVIRNCVFRASDKFVGENLLELHNVENGLIEGCLFDHVRNSEKAEMPILSGIFHSS